MTNNGGLGFCGQGTLNHQPSEQHSSNQTMQARRIVVPSWAARQEFNSKFAPSCHTLRCAPQAAQPAAGSDARPVPTATNAPPPSLGVIEQQARCNAHSTAHINADGQTHSPLQGAAATHIGRTPVAVGCAMTGGKHTMSQLAAVELQSC